MPETPESKRWIQLASERLIERWWMTLRVDRVQIPGGPVLEEFHVVEYPDWACVLALTDDGEALVVDQYRYAIERMSLELPAGAIDPGEAPLTGAKRELLEETGYAADHWVPLGTLAVEPSRHTNYAHLFVATGARRVADQSLDESEDLSVRLVPSIGLPRLVESGEVVHGIHAALIHIAAFRGLLG